MKTYLSSFICSANSLVLLKLTGHLVPYNNNITYLRIIFIIKTLFKCSFFTIAVPIDTSYIKKNVIGGTADIIHWADDSFRMDIQPGSFTKGHNVDILVSMSRSHQFEIPKGYKLFSQTYEIRVSEKLQQPVTFTLKHNAAISTEDEAKSLVILHQTDEGEIEILQGYTEPNSSFITFQLTELSNVSVIGPNDINTKYVLSFYRQKINSNDNNPQLQILALVSQSEQILKVSYTVYIYFIIIICKCFRKREMSC